MFQLTVEECVNNMKRNLSGSVVSVTYKQCCDSEIGVVPKPSENNKYHTGLENNQKGAPDTLLTDIQCQNLADYAVFEYKDFENI